MPDAPPTNEKEINALPQADKVRMARLVLSGWRFTRSSTSQMWLFFLGETWSGARLTLSESVDRAAELQELDDEVSAC